MAVSHAQQHRPVAAASLTKSLYLARPLFLSPPRAERDLVCCNLAVKPDNRCISATCTNGEYGDAAADIITIIIIRILSAYPIFPAVPARGNVDAERHQIIMISVRHFLINYRNVDNPIHRTCNSNAPPGKLRNDTINTATFNKWRRTGYVACPARQ